MARQSPRQTEKEIRFPARDKIVIRGARVHNLKNIDVEIPRNKLVVVTGLSGSGKSSLAFDTIYAEGQRRYVESLSAYARQFLGVADKPDVDYIEGLSPAISIDQKAGSRNPRSTVGTVTEIYDYLRLLFARIGRPHCPQCGRPVRQQTVSQMVDQVMANPEGTRVQILAPLVRGKKGEHQKLLSDVQHKGFVRVRVNGEIRELGEEIALDRNRKHDIEVVVDRLVVRPGLESRLADSLETALELGGGTVTVLVQGAASAEAGTRPEAGAGWRQVRWTRRGRKGRKIHSRRGRRRRETPSQRIWRGRRRRTGKPVRLARRVRSTPSARTSPARSAASAWRRSNRGSSPSTAPSEPARSARAWATTWRWTSPWWSIRTCRCGRGR